MDFLQFAGWLAGAVVVVGLIQWAKGLLPSLPGWVWSLAMAAVAFGVGYSIPGQGHVFNGLGVWAIAQLGWDAILKGVIAAIQKRSSEAKAVVSRATKEP